MEFIKKMKKREFIEMSLKTIAAILGCFIAIILMEGMIYSIQLSALIKKSESKNNSFIKYGDSVAYCVKKADNKYCVIYYHEDLNEDGKTTVSWNVDSNTYTIDKLTAENLGVKDVKLQAPNAFQLSIKGIHFLVMAIFILAVGGFYAYRFVKLGKEYKRIETEFKKTGTIEISNR